ncbi:MAG: thiamine pyrophosphate-dependent enzyme [Brevinematales bacterium]|nr:thiamine pyrophosphate-dependent enzyme [Brevinematales bacterium]
MKELLSGNEAIARGAFEANVWVATGYPGTPSSEVIYELSDKYKEINSEWSVNEKVALEIAIGSSLAGARSIVTMKHVGLNVAADPLMTLTYTGVNAGLLIYVADDPGMHSSQNEQDTRNYGEFAKIPLLEPSDSMEAKEFTKLGLEISEKFDTPVILRGVTRVAHSKTVVELATPKRKKPHYNYEKNKAKYVMMPLYAFPRHPFVIERFEKLKEYSNEFHKNSVEYRNLDIGIITHGYIYNYVKEVFPDASIFKVSLYPLPIERIKEFASKVKKLYVIEELDPFIEKELKVNGINCIGKEIIPTTGELSVDIIKKSFNIENKYNKINIDTLPKRPPVLCKGCGHIPVFEVLNELKVSVMGDIGCYTLGALPPYDAMDTTVCMGASVGMEIGFKKVEKLVGKKLPSVGVIGDSTFLHSGMTHLINAVYNKDPITLIILDNRITAMTGHQPNATTGLNNKFEKTDDMDLVELVKGLGVKRVVRANAYKKDELKKLIQQEINSNEVSVIIVDEICVIAEGYIKKFR